MAVGIHFAVAGMSPEKYATVHEQLVDAGHGDPPGRSFHAGYVVGDEIHVFDVWESREAFEAFGEHLIPILTANGIDPGTPSMGEIERVIARG